MMRRLAIACLILSAACGGATDPIPAGVRQQVADARDAVTPAAVQLDEVVGPTREGARISASWSFALNQPWQEYEAWLVPRLGARGYRRIDADDKGSCTFSQRLTGDLLTVLVRVSGTPPRVRVDFWARPD